MRRKNLDDQLHILDDLIEMYKRYISDKGKSPTCSMASQISYQMTLVGEDLKERFDQAKAKFGTFEMLTGDYITFLLKYKKAIAAIREIGLLQSFDHIDEELLKFLPSKEIKTA